MAKRNKIMAAFLVGVLVFSTFNTIGVDYAAPKGNNANKPSASDQKKENPGGNIKEIDGYEELQETKTGDVSDTTIIIKDYSKDNDYVIVIKGGNDSAQPYDLKHEDISIDDNGVASINVSNKDLPLVGSGNTPNISNVRIFYKPGEKDDENEDEKDDDDDITPPVVDEEDDDDNDDDSTPPVVDNDDDDDDSTPPVVDNDDDDDDSTPPVVDEEDDDDDITPPVVDNDDDDDDNTPPVVDNEDDGDDDNTPPVVDNEDDDDDNTPPVVDNEDDDDDDNTPPAVDQPETVVSDNSPTPGNSENAPGRNNIPNNNNNSSSNQPESEPMETLDLEAIPLGSATVAEITPAAEEGIEEESPETEAFDLPEDIELTGEAIPLGDALPQTGQVAGSLYYGLGSILSFLGIALKKKK